MPARKSIPRRLDSTYGPVSHVDLTPPYCLELEDAELSREAAEKKAINLVDRGNEFVQGDERLDDDGGLDYPFVQVQYPNTTEQSTRQSDVASLNFGNGAIESAGTGNQTSPLSDLDAMIREKARKTPVHTYMKRPRTMLASKDYMQVDLALGRHYVEQRPGNGEDQGVPDAKSRTLAGHSDTRYRLQMVPNVNLTFKMDHPPEDARVRTHSRVTAQWSQVIDCTLLTTESESRAGRTVYAKSYMDPDLCATPLRAPFTAFNSKQLRESASKAGEKELSNFHPSKKGESDSVRVYGALRFVELDISNRDLMQQGIGASTSSKKAKLKHSADKRDLQPSTKRKTVRLGKGNDNAGLISIRAVGQRHDGLSAASPLAFHSRRHTVRPLATTQAAADFACDTSMNHDPTPSITTDETPRVMVAEPTSLSSTEHGSRKGVAAPTIIATEFVNTKPLSTMIGNPDNLLGLLKRVEQYEAKTPAGIPLRRPKRAKNNSTHPDGQSSEYAIPPAATLSSHINSPTKAAVEIGGASHIPAFNVAKQCPVLPSCLSLNPPGIFGTDLPDLPELFAQKYKILPLPSMDLEMELSEEQLPAAAVPSAPPKMQFESQKHTQLITKMHTHCALDKGITSMKSSTHFAEVLPNNSK
ncbi:hypothetical protein QFC22_000306 [Naganishia vaughanmartiniae]|uniref:Uncharacterized protein n=1 Tax=Naganishia vaughanmartiniae TaxID=1424756 RepID=A0ACC2XNX8_9TREE|nr:hypothetical protein QFC22_000306 [Naganishia vaughanmartiniae]